MKSLINFRLSIFLLSSVLIFLLSCSKDKEPVGPVKSDKAEIKSWKIEDKLANIDGTDITIDLSYGTDITALQADVQLSSGASISPDPVNIMDYTNPVNFKVTAEDGKTTKTYKVKVSAAKNNGAAIKSWKFGSKLATIRGTGINITLSSGTDITGLKADVQLSTGASISPDPANSRDYTNPVKFKVKSPDGTVTKTYKVTVSVLNNKIDIKSWKFGSEVATISGTDITIALDYGTDITGLKADVQLSTGASISPDPTTSINYTNTVDFTVTSEDGSVSKTYKVTVRVLNNKANIKSWQLSGILANIRGTDITISLPYATNVSSLTAVYNLSSGASISPDPTNSIDYTSPVTFTVTSEDGSVNKNYKVTIRVENPILSLTAGWKNADKYTATINHNTGKINIDVNSADFDIKVNLSQGVRMTPVPSSITDWTRELTFTTIKGSKTKIYKVKVTVYGKSIIKVTDANIKSVIKSEIVKHGNTTDYNYIDVRNVTNMDSLFSMCDFNGNIGRWDVSKVTTMEYMFGAAAECGTLRGTKFNTYIGAWDVSNVINMKEMFSVAKAFNQDIGDWDVSNVTDMTSMFNQADKFNQDIGSWTVSKVTTMEKMFYNAAAFNQNIGGWTVSSVKNMSYMFKGANTFNQDIGGWNVSKVTTMQRMFLEAYSFNKNIENWNVFNVRNMYAMFYRAIAFDQNISGWRVVNVRGCTDFSFGSALRNANKPNFTACRE